MNTTIKKSCSVLPDLERIDVISKKLGLHKRLIELLFSRGIDTEERIQKFLSPNNSALYDPFGMKNMREVVCRLQLAIDNSEKIIVYGDYDADGVCSSAILALFFASRGIDVVVHIPKRIGDGYGLSIESLETLIEEHCPDMILTCDCGITGVKEVEHCADLGVDIIVTDHHEPGEILPDCLIINPKQSEDTYPDKFLCGAGVALKLVQALCGDDSYLEFLDLAAVATIADLVPLLDENRLIVQLGLKKLSSSNCNYGLKRLLASQGISGTVMSQDIAFKIAPRINAAGRMGDAYRAFEMLTLCDEKRIDEIIAAIEEDNDGRKTLCDTIYFEAETDLTFEDIVNNRAIVLCNPEWAKGVTGIAAARFAGDYNRPTFIIVDRSEDGIYKGTARGIKGINIYDALSYCSDILLEFGGHTGAAGFSIKEENIEAFKVRLNEYMSKLPSEYFMPSANYDLDVSVSECGKQLLDAVNMIEPTGNSNSKPLFRVLAQSVKLSPCKNPQHSSVQIDGFQTYAFNFFKRNHLLMGEGNKEIVFELTDGLGGRTSGYVKAVGISKLFINDTLSTANYLSSLLLPEQQGDAVFTKYIDGDLETLLPDSMYGTLFVCADRASYDKVNDKSGSLFITHDYMYKSEKNNYSGIIVSPSFDDSLIIGNYKRIVFLDSPPSENLIKYLNSRTKAEIYVPEKNTSRLFLEVSFDREVFARYYAEIIRYKEAANINPIVHFKRLLSLSQSLNASQFVVCLAVFTELGFFSFNNGNFVVDTSVRKPLTESEIFLSLSGVKI